MDGLDWDTLGHLSERALMPCLAGLISGGTWAPVGFPPPRIPDTDWTTVATGALPDVHGVLHAVARTADGLFLRPHTAGHLGAAGLWTVTDRAGCVGAVIGWPATHGLALTHGVVVDPGVEQGAGQGADGWPLDPASVRPAAQLDAVRGLRLHPAELRPEDIEFFLAPVADVADWTLRHDFAHSLAACVSAQALATHALDAFGAGFLMLRLPWLADVARILGRCADHAGHAVALGRCHQFLDLLVARLPGLAGPMVATCLVSTGGRSAPGAARTPASAGSGIDGFVVFHGPTFASDAVIGAVGAQDIAPTFASALGFDDAWMRDGTRASDGMVIVEAFASDDAKSPDTRSRASQPVPAPLAVVRTPARPALDLAYFASESVPLPDFGTVVAAARSVEAGTLLGLAEARLHGRGAAAALPVLDDLLDRFPDDLPGRVLLAEVLLRLRDLERLDAVLASLPGLRQPGPWRDLADGLVAFARGHWPDAVECFTRLAEGPSVPIDAHAWRARALAAQGRWQDARPAFAAAAPATRRDPGFCRDWGECCSRLGLHGEAAAAFGMGVAVSPESVDLLLALAAAHEADGNLRAAASARRRAILLDPVSVARQTVDAFRREP